MVVNYDEYGKVVCAALFHDNCIYMSYKGHYAIFPMEPNGVLRNAFQGFVTENGYYVDRKFGLLIAKHFDQIDTKYPPLDSLNSEDLKKENIKVLKYVKDIKYKN